MSTQRKTRQLQELAQDYSEEALETIVYIMRQDFNSRVRLAAAEMVLDRAIGRPTQTVEGKFEHVTPEEKRETLAGMFDRLAARIAEASVARDPERN